MSQFPAQRPEQRHQTGCRKRAQCHINPAQRVQQQHVLLFDPVGFFDELSFLGGGPGRRIP